MLLFILCAGFISAQEVTIIDALTSEPIAGVSLYNQTKDRNTISDDSGKCTVALFDEKDIISFQYMGYELKQFNKQELKRKNYIVSLNIDRKELSCRNPMCHRIWTIRFGRLVERKYPAYLIIKNDMLLNNFI